MGLNELRHCKTRFTLSNVVFAHNVNKQAGLPNLNTHTLQRQNTKILKQIFPEKEYRVSVPISTFMRLLAIYIFPGSVCLILLEEIYRPILGLY
jgi:hypothetical protein